MEKNVRLKIVLPNKLFKELDTHRVIIPGEQGDLTVLPERAPTVMTLTSGYVRVLDAQDKVIDKYFITGGLADISDNTCTVSSEAVIPEEDIQSLGAVNYTNWRLQKERMKNVIERYQDKLKKDKE